jgi:hypothetical protein
MKENLIFKIRNQEEVNKSKRIIGIVGGMGPYTGINIFIVDSTQVIAKSLLREVEPSKLKSIAI